MSRLFRSLFFLLLLGFFTVATSEPVFAVAEHEVSDPSSYNIHIGGPQASSKIGHYQIGYANFDNDGKTDLILTEAGGSYRTFILLGSYLTEHVGETIDLADSGSYFLQYSPATAGENNSYFSSYGSDLDGNGTDELIISHGIATEAGISDRGAVYVIYDSIISGYTGTGNDVSLSDTSAWNIKLVGAAATDNFGTSFYAYSDINLDNLPDLVVSSLLADNGLTDNGSVYLIYSSLLNTYKSSTNTILSMADAANYNVRIDGAIDSSTLISFTFGSDHNYDYDNDGKDDVVVMGPQTAYAAVEGGSYYFISNTLLSGYVGTGNVHSLANPSNFNIRFDSGNDAYSVGYSIIGLGDLNNNQKTDLVLTAGYEDNAPFTANGGIYLIYDDLVDDFIGTGNTADLTSSTQFTHKFTGRASDLSLGESAWIADYNNDGKPDILTHDFTNVFLLFQDIFLNFSGTGNTSVMGDPGTYSVRYTTPTTSMISTYNLADINGDGSKDFIFTKDDETFLGRVNAGASYIIFNFPHTVSVDAVSSVTANSPALLTGQITAPDSTTTIAGVQYLVDAQNPDNASWTNCSANDGTFDSTTENYTCAVSPLGNGSHTISLRAVDENGVYTASSRYAQVSFSVQQSSVPSSNPSRPDAPNCSSLRPDSAPQLFQIDARKNSVNLFFVPVVGNTDRYFIRYGTDPGNLLHGYEFPYAASNGVIAQTISYLQSNTLYYFQVRAGNNCMPGDWGNVLKAKTTTSNSLLKRFYLLFSK